MILVADATITASSIDTLAVTSSTVSPLNVEDVEETVVPVHEVDSEVTDLASYASVSTGRSIDTKDDPEDEEDVKEDEDVTEPGPGGKTLRKKLFSPRRLLFPTSVTITLPSTPSSETTMPADSRIKFFMAFGKTGSSKSSSSDEVKSSSSDEDVSLRNGIKLNLPLSFPDDASPSDDDSSEDNMLSLYMLCNSGNKFILKLRNVLLKYEYIFDRRFARNVSTFIKPAVHHLYTSTYRRLLHMDSVRIQLAGAHFIGRLLICQLIHG